MKNHNHIAFVVMHGAGATGTVVVTAESCDDVTPTTATAIPFKYKVATGADTFGALLTAAAAGFTIAAGATQMAVIEIDAAALVTGDAFVRLQLTEGVDSPVDAAVLAILSEPRYAGDTVATALA